MAKQRMVNTKFWDDTYISELSLTWKLLFIYLITNSLTNICWIYEIPLKRISYDTGINVTDIKKILVQFWKDKKIVYIEWWMYVINFSKHQNYNSPKIKIAIERERQSIPKNILDYTYGIDTVSKGIDTHSHLNLNLNLDSNLDLNNTTNVVLATPESYGDPEINSLLEKVKIYNNWICDWTQKEQRQYWKQLLTKLKEIESVKNNKYSATWLLEIILKIISKSDYHSHKIVWPKKIYYELAWLMQVCKQEFQKEEKSKIPFIPWI